ncbi:hypothetical protein OGAPHI_006713 [Ogataea philodendri]|uniref:RRM domain-containing protein n=1 Tax=Ogataea philodendri TaxID=1378263 RepID=A0A9P8T0D1_9ASCO|nr:uncharacterized protein OGAPHI_006713 [Ogataea philodendri]KAH3661306.1 hypothetical protein OGAPHI_006713 [Ogataea philodendri]
MSASFVKWNRDSSICTLAEVLVAPIVPNLCLVSAGGGGGGAFLAVLGCTAGADTWGGAGGACGATDGVYGGEGGRGAGAAGRVGALDAGAGGALVVGIDGAGGALVVGIDGADGAGGAFIGIEGAGVGGAAVGRAGAGGAGGGVGALETGAGGGVGALDAGAGGAFNDGIGGADGGIDGAEGAFVDGIGGAAAAGADGAGTLGTLGACTFGCVACFFTSSSPITCESFLLALIWARKGSAPAEAPGSAAGVGSLLGVDDLDGAGAAGAEGMGGGAGAELDGSGGGAGAPPEGSGGGGGADVAGALGAAGAPKLGIAGGFGAEDDGSGGGAGAEFDGRGGGAGADVDGRGGGRGAAEVGTDGAFGADDVGSGGGGGAAEFGRDGAFGAELAGTGGIGAELPGIGGGAPGTGGADNEGTAGADDPVDSRLGLDDGNLGAELAGGGLETGSPLCLSFGIPPAKMSPNWGAPDGMAGADGAEGIAGALAMPIDGAWDDPPDEDPATSGLDLSLVTAFFRAFPLRMSPRSAPLSGVTLIALIGVLEGGPPIGGAGGGGGGGGADMVITKTSFGKHLSTRKFCMLRRWYSLNRTLLVSKLPFNVTEQQVGDVFKVVGGLRKVELAKEHGKLKGYGYAEFESEEQARAAQVQLQGKVVNNMPIRLDLRSEVEQRQKYLEDKKYEVLLIRNLPYDATEKSVLDLFSPMQGIRCGLAKAPISDQCLGYGFVRFLDANVALNAVRKIKRSPLHLNGRKLKVEFAKKKVNGYRHIV